MPRRKHYDTIREYDLQKIESQVSALERVIRDTDLRLTHSGPHGQALMQLRKDLNTAVNLLNNRPADYFRHNGHMSPQQVAWHDEFERKCRESGHSEPSDRSSPSAAPRY
jgi:hypothetical protein